MTTLCPACDFPLNGRDKCPLATCPSTKERQIGIFDLLNHFADEGRKSVTLDLELYRLALREISTRQQIMLPSFYKEIGLQDEVAYCGMRVLCGDK